MRDVLAWHCQIQEDVLAALHAAPETWFNWREHLPEWPNDFEGHCHYHRLNDIETVLGKTGT